MPCLFFKNCSYFYGNETMEYYGRFSCHGHDDEPKKLLRLVMMKLMMMTDDGDGQLMTHH